MMIKKLHSYRQSTIFLQRNAQHQIEINRDNIIVTIKANGYENIMADTIITPKHIIQSKINFCH